MHREHEVNAPKRLRVCLRATVRKDGVHCPGFGPSASRACGMWLRLLPHG